MTGPLARLRRVSPGALCGLVLALAAAANYLNGQYGGAVAAGVGAMLVCAFAVLLGDQK